MTYKLTRANSFKRSFNDDEELAYIEVVYTLLNAQELQTKYKDHALKGDFQGFRECHIKPDLLLVYRIIDNTLELVDIGSHSDLFG